MVDAPSGLPVEFETVVACDFIRQENNGKHILVGVYGVNIGVARFPVNMRLSWWIVVRPNRIGAHKAEFRILGPRDAQLIAGQMDMNIKETNKNAILRLDNLPLQLQAEGELQFQIKFAEADWLTIKRMDIVHRPRPLVAVSPAA
jgi:hypothetical protein